MSKFYHGTIVRHDQRVYFEDVNADLIAGAFFKQCVRDGRLTAEELRDLNRSGGPGGAAPPLFKSFEDFVCTVSYDTGWSKPEVRRYLACCMNKARVTVRDIEAFINFPAWTQPELGEKFGIHPSNIRDMRMRVCRAWPRLSCRKGKGRGRSPQLFTMRSLDIDTELGTLYDHLDANVTVIL